MASVYSIIAAIIRFNIAMLVVQETPPAFYVVAQ